MAKYRRVTIQTYNETSNKKSLCLDWRSNEKSPNTGRYKRGREYLGITVYKKPKDSNQRQENKELWRIAEQHRVNKENEINKDEVYSEFEKERLKQNEIGERNFVDYFKELANKRKGSNNDNWMSALNYLVAFTGGHLKFADVTVQFCNDFKEYLLTTKSRKSEKAKLAQNSALSYFNKLKAALKQAYKDGLLREDINIKVKAIKEKENQREYLLLDEVKQLIKTDCTNVLMKKAALFSISTGLRFGDIRDLTWSNIEKRAENKYFIRFRQEKTQVLQTVGMNSQAYSLLGKKGKPTEKIFEGLQYSAYHNKSIAQWIGAAGITKDITFHCFRHTFAVLQLMAGTTIFTLKELMGHKSINTTLRYAKIVDEKINNAADKIQLDFTPLNLDVDL